MSGLDVHSWMYRFLQPWRKPALLMASGQVVDGNLVRLVEDENLPQELGDLSELGLCRSGQIAWQH